MSAARDQLSYVHKYKLKYGGMNASMITELQATTNENRRPKRMYGDMSMQNDLLKEVLLGKKR